MNRLIKVLWCVVPFFSLLVCPGLAQSEVELSWESCLAEARSNHPDILAAQAALDGIKAGLKEVNSTRLPQLSASAGSSIGKVSGRSRNEEHSYRLSARQLLFDGFKTANDAAVQRKEISAAEYHYLVVSANVRLNLRTAFVELLNAQEFLGVTDGILARRQQNEDVVNLQYQVGREHKGSLLTARANTARAACEYEQALRNVELAQIRLSRALGWDQFKAIRAQGQLDSGSADRQRPDFELLIDSTPVLKYSLAKKESARYALKSASSNFWPQIFFDAGAGKTGADWPADTSDWSSGLTLSFPLFQGGARKAALDRAKAGLQQAEAEYRVEKNGLLLTLAQAWTSWQDSLDLVDVQIKFLEASTQRSSIVGAQYTAGQASFNEWSIIEDDLVRDQKTLLQARMNALIAQAAWQQAKGETLHD